MKIGNAVAALAAAHLLAACAQTPDIKLGYHFARAEMSVRVVRTVVCDEANRPVIVTSVTPTVVHSADLDRGKLDLPIKSVASSFANADVKLERWEDGRIKGVNATSVGQGEVIVKTIASIVPMLPFDGPPPPTFPDQCAFIKASGGGKPLTLIFDGPVNLKAAPGNWKEIPAEIGSAFYFSRLSAAMGSVCASVTGSATGVAPVDPVSPSGKDVRLRLRQPGRVAVRVAGHAPTGGCGSAAIWDGVVLAGQAGVEYDLPIPRAALFGKQAFAVSVGETGALLSVQYGQEAGTSAILNAVGSALTAISGDTAAVKAAELKSEADLIAQQQRLALCKAKPAECK